MVNLYWPAYKRLENELISMTSDIRFDDDQIGVYSDKFMEILIRTSIEIEAISKELYLNNGGEKIEPESDMFFDTVCLQFLEEKWNLSKKCVLVNGVFFSFDKEENKILTPLRKANKRGTSGAKWKQAYQAVKHNRNKNYKLGNMKNCVVALAALYILNIYYKDEVFQFADSKDINNFDQTQGSTIFSIMISKGNSFNGYIDVDEKSIYCINYTEEFVKSWEKKKEELNRLIYEQIANEQVILDAINSGQMKVEEIVDISKVQNCIGNERFNEIIKNATIRININQVIQNRKFYAYLNKVK